MDNTGLFITEESTEGQMEQQLLYCKVCNFQGTNLETYVKHVRQRSHIVKSADAYNVGMVKAPGPQIYDCHTCLVQCNGEASLSQHLQGQKHRKAVVDMAIRNAEKEFLGKNYGGDGVGPIKQKFNKPDSNPYQRSPYISAQEEFISCKEPLIGLEYVNEYQVAGQNPKYVCKVCDSTFDSNCNVAHLIGVKHRVNVLKQRKSFDCKNTYSSKKSRIIRKKKKKPEVLSGPKPRGQKRSEMTAALLEEARKLEEEEGRQQVRVICEDVPMTDVQTSEATGHSESIEQTKDTRGCYMNDQGSTGRDQGGGPRGGRGVGRGGGRGGGRGDDWQPPLPLPDPYGNLLHGNPLLPLLRLHNTPYGGQFNNMPYKEFDRLNPGNFRPSLGCPFPGPRMPLSFTPNHFRPIMPPDYLRPTMGGDSSFPTKPIPPHEKQNMRKFPPKDGLRAAFGDLNKLIQNEEDAAYALSVSNTLTQALLKYRLNQNEDRRM